MLMYWAPKFIRHLFSIKDSGNLPVTLAIVDEEIFYLRITDRLHTSICALRQAGLLTSCIGSNLPLFPRTLRSPLLLVRRQARIFLSATVLI